MSDAYLYVCKVCGRVYGTTQRGATDDFPDPCECGGPANEDVDPYYPIGGVER